MNLLILWNAKQEAVEVIDWERSNLFSHDVDHFLDDEVEVEGDIPFEEEVEVNLEDTLPILLLIFMGK